MAAEERRPRENEGQLGPHLRARGLLTAPRLDRAERRRQLYGGTLDTVLLELALIDEDVVARALSEATGLPEGPQGEILAGPKDARERMDPATCRNLSAVPLALIGDRLRVAIHIDTSIAGLHAWAQTVDLLVEPLIVPQMRFEALFAASYGVSVAPRFAALLGRLMGRDQARRWANTHTPQHRPTVPVIETAGPRQRPTQRLGTEVATPQIVPANDDATVPVVISATALAALRAGPASAPGSPAPGMSAPPERLSAHQRPTIITGLSADIVAVPPVGPVPTDTLPDEDSVETLTAEPAALASTDPQIRRESLRKLRFHLQHDKIAPRLPGLRQDVLSPDKSRALRAIADLAALGDAQAVPSLIDRLGDADPDLVNASLVALVDITRHDFGTTRWRWGNWWRQARHQHRVQWLIAALGGKNPELRLGAALELEPLGDGYSGYHFDLDKRDRDEAQRRWQLWWQTTGRIKFARSAD